MRLTLTQRNATPDAAGCHAEFQAPGGTVGRGAENHLVLPDESGGICRVQAVVRVGADACYLHNLSSMSYVSLNDRPVRQGQEIPLSAGDVLRIGPYALEAALAGNAIAEPAPAAAAAAPLADPEAPQPFPEAEPAPADAKPADDVFSGLFGPGTLPVGSAPEVSAHPFELDSAQARNAEDPLAHLPRGDANVSGRTRDPLDLFEAPHGGDDVFADRTPSTLPSHDPLAPLRADPVDEVLRGKRDESADGPAARDHLRESGGFLRPAKPRSKPPGPDKG
ncbi:FHA domain-containing protein [Bordetella sp. 2513F-2]